MYKYTVGLIALFASHAAFAQVVTPVAAPERPTTLVQPDQPPPGAPEEQKRKPLSIRQIMPISFGAFANERSGGTVTISPSGARMQSGAISLMDNGQAGPAEYEINGQPNEQVQLILPEQVTLDKGGSSLPIINLKAYPDGEITLDRAGRARIKIGGTLRVSGQPTPGNYDGLFNIDVRYSH